MWYLQLTGKLSTVKLEYKYWNHALLKERFSYAGRSASILQADKNAKYLLLSLLGWGGGWVLKSYLPYKIDIIIY